MSNFITSEQYELFQVLTTKKTGLRFSVATFKIPQYM